MISLNTVTDIDTRRRRLGMSTASLARESDVKYDRVYRGTIKDEELGRVEDALRARERALLVALAGLAS